MNRMLAQCSQEGDPGSSSDGCMTHWARNTDTGEQSEGSGPG